MFDPEKEIEKRCKALAKSINRGMEAHYKQAGAKAAGDKGGKGKGGADAKDKKAKGGTAEPISVFMSRDKASKTRTPEEQAELVAKGTSWTCNSSHMSGAARHVLIKVGRKVTWNIKKLAKTQKEAFEKLVEIWQANMKKEDLRNYKRGKDFLPNSADPLHMELPNSRLKDNDKRVVQCLEAYAKATREGKGKKNEAFEKQKGSDFQKKWLQTYDKKHKTKK